MPQANQPDTTTTDFLSGYHKAYEALSNEPMKVHDAKGDEIIESATARSREVLAEVLAKPNRSMDDIARLAAVAFYWKADAADEDGSPCFDMESLSVGDRAVAELILAVLARAKKDALNS